MIITSDSLRDARGYLLRDEVQQRIRLSRANAHQDNRTGAERAATIHNCELDLYCIGTLTALVDAELRWAPEDHPHEGDPDHGRGYASQTKEPLE